MSKLDELEREDNCTESKREVVSDGNEKVLTPQSILESYCAKKGGVYKTNWSNWSNWSQWRNWPHGR